MNRTDKWTPEETDLLVELKRRNLPWREIARALGRSEDSCWSRYNRLQMIRVVPESSEDTAASLARTVMAQIKREDVAVEKPPPATRDLQDIIASLREEHVRKAAHHGSKRDGIKVEIGGEGPYILSLFGDPHVGDPGCDLAGLIGEMDACTKADDCYMVNMGDVTNNWVGALARLYGYQQATVDEEKTLIDWLIGSYPWLFIVLGNHDKWTSFCEDSCQRHNVAYVSHGSKFLIERGGHRTVCEFRHHMPGRSMYNAAHGSTKRAFRGSDSHLIVGAHTHEGAIHVTPNPVTRRVPVCANVSSWKKDDEYADTIGADSCPTPPVLHCVVDTRLKDEPGQAWPFYRLDHAIAFRDGLKGLIARGG